MSEYFFHYTYPRLLESVLLCWAGLLFLNFKAVVAAFRPLITRYGALCAALIFAAALLARIAVFPPRHQVYFDEFLDEDVAVNMAHGNVFGESEAGGSHGQPILRTPSRPGGFHVLLGAVFRLTGFSEKAAFRLNAVLAAASTTLIFLLAALIFQDQRAGLFSAFLLAALPLHIRYSGTTELTACSGFWILAALLALALYLKIQTLPLYLLLLASALYAANVRFENLILVPFVGAVLARYWRRSPPKPKTGYLASPCAFFLLLLPVIGLILNNRREDLLGFNDAPLGALLNLAHHLPMNLLYFFTKPADTLILAPLAAFALYKQRGEGTAWVKRLLLLGLLYLLVCSLHVSADFNDGAFDRLAVPFFLCVILAAACGFKIALERSPARKFIAAGLPAAFVLLSLPYYGGHPPERLEAENRLVLDSAALLPPDAYVIAYSPPYILVDTGRPSISTALVLQGGENSLDLLDHQGRSPLILFKDLLWFKYADQTEPLETLLRRRYDYSPLKVAMIDSKEYGFYRLTRKRT